MEEVERNDLLNSVDVDGRLKANLSVDDNDGELISTQFMNLHRLPENLPKVQLVTDPLGADLLNHQVVELATSSEFVNTTVGGQYYDEEILAHDLTEEDKRLAAALVAVQLVHQQKQQQFAPELLNTKTMSPLSPLQSVSIEKPTVAAMVTSYFQAFDDETPQQLYETQPSTSPLQEIRLPPLKKVYSINRPRFERTLLDEIENPEEPKEVITKTGGKSRKNDALCDNIVRDACTQEFPEAEASDLECDTELKPSRRSLPHKKRIPRKLKSQPGQTNARLPLHSNSVSKGYKSQKNDNGLVSGVATISGEGSTQGGTKKSLSSGFSCELCGVISINQIKFFEHLKSHYEPNLIQVDINDQNILEYATNDDTPIIQDAFGERANEVVMKLDLDSLSCHQCARIFKRKKALESHMASEHPAIEEFSEPEDMMEGIRHVVNIQTATADEETDSKHRSWRLSDELSIEDDMLLDGDKDDEIKEEEDDKNKKKKKAVQCPHCTRTFTHRNSLLYHVRSHSGRRPYQCDVCGKGFFAANALRVHMRMHSGDKPYKCDVCLRHFRQWGDLKYHMTSIHSATKQYQCEFCGKDFARKYSLIVHRRIHTGEKNYVCEYCRKTFRASSYLVNHRRIHTGEKPYNCDVCHKPFRVKSDMKRHRNTHNKDRGLNNTAANSVNVGIVLENVNNDVQICSRQPQDNEDVISVGEAIAAVDETLLTTTQIPLNLNIRHDTTDTLSGTLERDQNTLYVWLPPPSDSILPD